MKESLETAAWKFSSERSLNALDSRNDFVAALHRHTMPPVDEFADELRFIRNSSRTSFDTRRDRSKSSWNATAASIG